MRRGMAIVAMLMTLVMLAGCTSGSAPAGADKPPIKIGGIFDLTGGTADVGVPHADGARAYMDYINGKGGVNGRKIELIGIDYAYQTPKAVEAYDKLVQRDNVIAVMGWGTGDTEAMKGKIAADKIPYISGSYSEQLIDPAQTPYNFIVAATYSQQARVLLDHAKATKANAKVGMIFHDSAFGRSPLEDAQAYAAKIGLTWVGEAALPGNAADATTQVLDLANKGIEFVLIQNVTTGTALVLKAAQQRDLLGKIQFMGLAYSVDENLIKAAGGASDGFVGTPAFSFPYEQGKGIEEALEYMKTKGKTAADLNQKWMQGWAFSRIMVEAIRRAGDNPTGESLKTQFESMKDYDLEGLGSPLTFTATDHGGAKKARIYQVKSGRWEPISEFVAAKGQ
jgi:branched-chain amino acid transport system substrate-binding protein